MRLSIRWKLMLAVGVPLLVVYLTILIVLTNQLLTRSRAQLERTVVEFGEHYAAQADSRLGMLARTVDTEAASLGIVADLSEAQRFRLLEHLVASELLVDAVWLALEPPAAGALAIAVERDAAGTRRRTVATESTGTEATAPAWLEALRRGDGAGWIESLPQSVDGERHCAYAAPVLADGDTIGVLVVTVRLATLREHLRSLAFEEGDYAILGTDGRLLVHPPDPVFSGNQTLAELVAARGSADLQIAVDRMLAGEAGVVKTEGLVLPGRRWLFYAPIPSSGWTFIGGVPESVVLAFSQSQLKLGLVILLIGLLVLLLLLWLVASTITRPVIRLAAAVDGLGRGDLDSRVTGVTSRDEIGELASAFNRMVGDLKHHVDALTRETAARQRVESELGVAREIQTALLPKRFPRETAFEIFAINVPARHVAGDFFDFFRLADGRMAVVMADVSGKGVPAALFMAFARTIVRQVCATRDSLPAAVARANELLEENNVGSMYVTMFLGWYDSASGALSYVNAGHPLPYRIDARGQATPLGEVTGAVVGLLPGREYTEGSARLEPGERLVLFTDGIPEAEDAAGEFFGDERFRSLLERSAGESVEKLCDGIARTLDQYQEGRRADDLTVLVLERKR